MKVVEIHAVDWSSYNASYRLDGDFSPMETRVIGYLVEDVPDHVTVAMEQYPKEKDPQIRWIICIPRVCIKAIYEYDKPCPGTRLGRPPNIKLGTEISKIENKNIIGGY